MKMKRCLVIGCIVLASATLAIAQEDSNSTRTRTVAPKSSPTPKSSPAPKSTTKSTNTNTNTNQSQSQRPKASSTPAGPSTSVVGAFDKIVEGIKRANVDLVTGAYWNSAALVLFNYNGSVTRGWDQMRKNREASYPDVKDVKLDIRDRHVIMLGIDGAVVTCLWTQTQTYKGQPDTASGRMTLVFKRVGGDWKAVHLHTSPDKPDASRIPASEQPPPPSL
jgi:ketosteroid isomerase-like protein